MAVSWFFYIMKVGLIPDSYSLDELVQRFVVGIAPYADRVGCWEDHVLSWIRLRSGTPSFRLVRDEDLLAQPVRELASLAPFLRIEVTEEQIEHALELSSANDMRDLERQQWHKWNVTKGTRADILFVKEATHAGSRTRLSPLAIEIIEKAWGGDDARTRLRTRLPSRGTEYPTYARERRCPYFPGTAVP